MARPYLKLLGSLSLGLVTGVALGAAYWTAAMTLQGHSLDAAIRGQVEDGLGLLQGLIALGALCGIGVGLFWGVAAMNRSQGGPRAAADGNR